LEEVTSFLAKHVKLPEKKLRFELTFNEFYVTVRDFGLFPGLFNRFQLDTVFQEFSRTENKT
jgi:hypothetical protein